MDYYFIHLFIIDRPSLVTSCLPFDVIISPVYFNIISLGIESILHNYFKIPILSLS